MTTPPRPEHPEGEPIEWREFALVNRRVPGDQGRPSRDDFSAHQHGFVPMGEEILRDRARELVAEAVARGMPGARARIAVQVGAAVEQQYLMAEATRGDRLSEIERRRERHARIEADAKALRSRPVPDLPPEPDQLALDDQQAAERPRPCPRADDGAHRWSDGRCSACGLSLPGREPHGGDAVRPRRRRAFGTAFTDIDD